MKSSISGIKTGAPTSAGTPARVVRAMAAGEPKRTAMSHAKPKSDVRV